MQTTTAEPGLVSSAFQIVGEFVGTHVPHVVTAIALLAYVVALIVEGQRAFRLLFRYYKSKPQDRWFSTLRMMAHLLVRDGTLLKIRRRKLFRRAMIVVEHEIFFEDIIATKQEGFMPPKASASARSKRAWWKERTWRNLDSPAPVFAVASPGAINDKFAEVRSYLRDVKELRAKSAPDHLVFESKIAVRKGFIAPLQLLTGLLVEFNEKWDLIIAGFERDAGDSTQMFGDVEGARNNRQIQMFIYNCWLLWGPSIPLCSCAKWRGKLEVIQYGFGDESNSVDIVGDPEVIKAQVGLLADKYEGAILPMALPAQVEGYLALSRNLPGGSHYSILPSVIQKNWHREQEDRPVLFIGELAAGDAREGDRGKDMRKVGDIDAIRVDQRSPYYSAYLWIAFVIEVRRTAGEGPWVALSQARGEFQPWKDLIPFFEHGNLADFESYRFAKKRLATKALDSIAEFADAIASGDQSLDYRLAFVCAIDESGCGGEDRAALDSWRVKTTTPRSPEGSIRQLIEAELEKRQVDPRFKAIKTRGIVELELDPATKDEARKLFRSCALPDLINAHYAHMVGQQELEQA